MSTKLAKQSLDLLLKQKRSSNASSSESKNDRRSLKLPDTKKGIKKVKYEMRYGHLQKKKAEEAKLKRKENPINMVIRDQEEAQDQFERNLRILTASRLKGTETEIDARKKLLEKAK